MSLLGLYLPGGSVLHRSPAWMKLLGLIALAALTQLLPSWRHDLLLLLLVLALYPLAGISLVFAVRQLRALWWVLAAIAVAQVVFASWQVATSVVATILLLVLAAGLVTLTTTTTAMSDVVVRRAQAVPPVRGVAGAGRAAAGAQYPVGADHAGAGRADPRRPACSGTASEPEDLRRTAAGPRPATRPAAGGRAGRAGCGRLSCRSLACLRAIAARERPQLRH